MRKHLAARRKGSSPFSSGLFFLTFLVIYSVCGLHVARASDCWEKGVCPNGTAFVLDPATGKLTQPDKFDRGGPGTEVFWAVGEKYEKTDRKYLAIFASNACSSAHARACAGTRYRRGEGKGLAEGNLVAFFPDGSAVAHEAGKLTVIDAEALKQLRLIPSKPQSTYRWLVSNGQAVGCIETQAWPADLKEECSTLPVPAVACSGGITERQISNLEECVEKAGADRTWVKNAGVQLCFSTTTVAGSLVLINYLRDQDCEFKGWEIADDCSLKNDFELPFHPLSKFGLNDLIPEIMNLSAKESVPAGLIEKYGSQRVAISLNFKKLKDRQKIEPSAPAGKMAYDFLNATELQMVFPEKIISMLADGGFKNWRQSGATGGASVSYGGSGRARAEKALLGRDIDVNANEAASGIANEVFPKYALLGLQGGPVEALPIDFGVHDSRSAAPYPTRTSTQNAQNYGNVIAVFNPDLKDRTTFSMGDSLNKIADPKTGGIVSNRRAPEEVLRPLKQRPEKSLAGESGEYVEAQIWGPIGLNDVHHFLVNCGSFNKISPDGLNGLRALNKPIYQCREERGPDGMDVVRIKAGEPMP